MKPTSATPILDALLAELRPATLDKSLEERHARLLNTLATIANDCDDVAKQCENIGEERAWRSVARRARGAIVGDKRR